MIELYWKKERGALNQRWNFFVGKAVPFLTRLTALFIKDGKIEDKYIGELSKQARIDIQELGPTFIKAGQMMSVRPDVLPPVSWVYFGWCKTLYFLSIFKDKCQQIQHELLQLPFCLVLRGWYNFLSTVQNTQHPLLCIIVLNN